MKIVSIKYIVISFLALIPLSCSEEWLDENPPHIITTKNVYTTLGGFEIGLNGLYADVRRELEGYSGGSDLISSLWINGTDNFVTNSINSNGASQLYADWRNTLSPNHRFISDVFSYLYSIINAANTIIEHAKREDIDWGPEGEANRNRVIAEAMAVRAWSYRHLTYGWGDVPLNLEESMGSNIHTDWTRSPVKEVRRQIISDFRFAEQHVDVEASLPGRITKGAIQTYLAEMYLTLHKPDSALLWANMVIDNPAYRLITERYGVKKGEPGVPYMDMFQDGNANREEGNTEALWVFQFANYISGGGGFPILRRTIMSRYHEIKVDGTAPFQLTLERGGRGQSRFSMSKWAIESYEPQDDRFSHHALRKYLVLKDADENAPYPADILPEGYEYGDTLKFDWSNPITASHSNIFNWPWPRKVDGTDPTNVALERQGNDQVYLRLAETYMLKAEAQHLLGLNDEAAETINIIRRRSNATEISASDVNIDFILDERSRELIVEENRRWTLLRTGKWYERTKAHNTYGGENIVLRDTILPIPQVIIDANLTSDMPQNPGYE